MIENSVPDYDKYEAVFSSLARAGWCIILGITGVTPQLYLSNYPEAWLDEYTKNHYAFSDPALTWGLKNEGEVRWSEVAKQDDFPDPENVMQKASKFGLNYGAVCSRRSLLSEGRVHMLMTARSDREFDDGDIGLFATHFERLITGYEGGFLLTADEKRCLRLVALGKTQHQIAVEIDRSLETVKNRLSSARLALGAKRTAEAVAIAQKRGMITL